MLTRPPRSWSAIATRTFLRDVMREWGVASSFAAATRSASVTSSLLMAFTTILPHAYGTCSKVVTDVEGRAHDVVEAVRTRSLWIGREKMIARERIVVAEVDAHIPSR